MHYSPTSSGKKKIKSIKSYPHSGMFWLHKFGKCTWWSASAGLSSSTIEINLLMTGIPWLFSLFVPFRPKFSVSSLVTITATWACSFLLQLKQTWSYSQLFRFKYGEILQWHPETSSELCSTLCSKALRQSEDTGCSALAIYTWLTENSQEKGCSCLARK